MHIAATRDAQLTPAFVLGLAVQLATGFAWFNHEYWLEVGKNKACDPIHALERQLFIASMFAAYPVHALVIYNQQVFEVVPFSNVPRSACPPMYILLHHTRGGWHTLAMSTSITDTTDGAYVSPTTHTLVLRNPVDVNNAARIMKGYIRAMRRQEYARQKEMEAADMVT